MFFILTKILSANIFDSLQLFIILTHQVITSFVHIFRDILHEILQSEALIFHVSRDFLLHLVQFLLNVNSISARYLLDSFKLITIVAFLVLKFFHNIRAYFDNHLIQLLFHNAQFTFNSLIAA
jgi:hypothetical protein